MGHDPKKPEAATIHVQYKFVDGYHVFTSEDVRGLYVASKDPQKAFEDVGPVLQELIAMKLKGSCEIEPTMTFDEFVAYIDARNSAPSAPVLASREFIVRRTP
jgi:hypothetical protein